MNFPKRNASRVRFTDRLACRLVRQSLAKLQAGSITIVDRELRIEFGDAGSDLQATVTVVNPRFYRRLCLGGGLGAAEALMDGDWTCDDLTSLVRIFVRNLDLAERMDSRLGTVKQAAARFVHWLRQNTRQGSAKNIRQHYDLGNDFFRLFLDDTMNYSCGIFEQPEMSMRNASIAKMDRACRKLSLQPSDHLLEIGTGWGALAIYAAQHYGCRVTTTTISGEQYQLAKSRISQAGLADQIDVLLCDYRDLEGQFDKLVSIEMIEAVGHEYQDRYFAECQRLLKPDGCMLLQGIVIKDQRHREHLRSVDFIRRYIFPGGCLPSISEILRSTTRVTDMRLLHLEDFAPHYGETLRRWRGEFWDRIDEVRGQGYPERFIRMWDYYLSYCEAVFEERQVNVVQMLLARADCRLDPISDISLGARGNSVSHAVRAHLSNGNVRAAHFHDVRSSCLETEGSY